MLTIDFENEKKLIFVHSSNPRYGFEVKFGDTDEVFSIPLDKDARIDLIKFLVQSL